MASVPALDLRKAANDTPLPDLPSNVELEQALLGCVLYDNAAFERVTDALQGHHFYEPFHGRLWDAAAANIRAGRLAEPVLLADRFGSDPAFEELGGIRYLADLLDRAPQALGARDYADAILDLAMRRELMVACADGLAAATDMEVAARDHIEAVEQHLFSLAEHQATAGFYTFEHYLTGAVDMAAQAFQREGGLSGLSTGLIDLDHRIGGLHPSDLIILAARPSMGKTALACNIAFDVARSYAFEAQPDGTKKTVRGGIVGFFSLEMSGEQLALRLLAEASGVSGDRLRRGDVQAHEFGRVRDAALEIQSAPLHIDATGGLSIAKLSARARRLKRTSGLDLIIVDYLQLVTCDGSRKGDSRVQDVTMVTQGLKALAKELDVPVVALSQLSRQVENREDKRPQLSDLRESGSIEQDADIVAFIYREAYYLSRTEPKGGTDEHFRWQEQMDQCRHLADLIIGKQRHGPIGTVKLSFNEDITKFGNLARDRGSYAVGEQRLPYAGGDE